MATRAAREKSFTSIAHLLGIKLLRQPKRHAVLGSLSADKRGLKRHAVLGSLSADKRGPKRHAVLGSLSADKRGLHPSNLHGQDFTGSLAAIHIIIIHVCYVFVTSGR